jgi:hypothetical protein
MYYIYRHTNIRTMTLEPAELIQWLTFITAKYAFIGRIG